MQTPAVSLYYPDAQSLVGCVVEVVFLTFHQVAAATTTFSKKVTLS